MTDILAYFVEYLPSVWKPFYWPVIAINLLLGLVLLRVARRMLLHTFQALCLVLIVLAAAAAAAMLGSDGTARGLQETATIILGALSIRLAGLTLFRQVLARMGMHPPRILEELLILVAYLGWLLVRLSYAGLDLSGLLASTAVITAVLAFAMQDTLGNILSGLALQLDRSIHIGDWVQIETVCGQVTQVQWRYTAVQTLMGEVVLIPNSVVMKSQVTLTGGLSVPRRLRIVTFYCDFDIDPSVVTETVERELSQATLINVASDPKLMCAVLDFNQGVISYALRYWLLNPEAPGGTDSLIRRHLYALFKRQGWRMAAPTQDLRVRSLRTASPSQPTAQGMAHRIAMLKGVSLLDPLTDDERLKLATKLTFLPYLAGSVITLQGDTGTSLFILTSGEVDVWLEGTGPRRHLTTLSPGEVMGEMSIMTGEPRRATLQARSDVECYALTKLGFEEILQSRPELAETFAQLLAQRSQELRTARDAIPTANTAVQKAAILDRIRHAFRLDSPP